MKGTKGDRGDKGATGKTGPKGSLGQRGSIGPMGIKGEKGIKGNLGKRGEPGPQGENGTDNSIYWKQCVWKRNDHKDTGLIQVIFKCEFYTLKLISIRNASSKNVTLLPLSK